MQTFVLKTSILILGVAMFAAGCSADEDSKGTAGTRAVSTTGSGGSGSTTTGDTATGSTTTSSGTTTTGTGTGGTGGGNDTPAALPFAVDSAFVASGFMGDGSTAGAIVQDDNGMCAASRPAGAVGHCHKFTYTPLMGGSWGGVYWQYPVNNWGDQPGKRIAAGATSVKFSAVGGAGGEVVTFLVGGMMGKANQDTLTLKIPQTLGTTAMEYSIDLSGQTYDAVLGAFGWTAEAPMGSTAPIVFTVDNIRWE
ncbi:MAG TPA: hypothetical protein VF881_17290 [Polyangiaceae bacterium]